MLGICKGPTYIDDEFSGSIKEIDQRIETNR